MKKIIHRLRKQPEEIRRHVLHVSILGISIIMVMLWVLSLGNNLTNPDTKEKIKEDLQPFSVLKDNLIEGYKSKGETDSSVTE